ncbi:DUF5926 family protein [Actinoalloteichus hymeniacidonis]|uniref:SEC-C motif-containing protein n=1 Tax=Actinoalloteichus hymeniacidonis TaxID=340345 RepID=A0AAC9HKJ7_9PSEU|nr:DUF5926 family protein [Actinoalloteichus hymeniacidonis]AOS60934.1 SEC-C motif-containing protein [Actinoalloteichus hymeniacidonis]MBB5911066.1 hypothetical protein [Actinoalloteichus hymeniacidonis]
MAKRTAVKRKDRTSAGDGGLNPRRPCECGSGKRFKACHGSEGGAADVIITRPFEGLAAEPELIALREFVPSAFAKLPLIDGTAEVDVTLASVLPMAAAGMRRNDDKALVGLQVQTRSGDLSRDVARSVLWAAQAKPGDVLPVVGPDDDPAGPRLQDILVADAPLDVQLHADFGWWIPEGTEASAEVSVSLERANEAIMPTERLNGPGIQAAYWVDAGEKAHLRWVRPEPEEKLLAAMARLAAAEKLALGEGSRYAGSFRAHGLLVPVWDLDRELHAREWEKPAAELGERLTEALASVDDTPLNESERRARAGLIGRQITLR